MTIQMHKKVKITVLRTEYYQELAEQYAIPNLGKCPFHQKGQVLYSDGINPPDGMCGVAWQVIAPMVRQLSLGELVQPSGTWLNDDAIGVFACPDGMQKIKRREVGSMSICTPNTGCPVLGVHITEHMIRWPFLFAPIAADLAFCRKLHQIPPFAQ